MKLLFGLGILFAYVTCVDAEWQRGKSIAEITSEEDDLSTLVTFLDKAGLVPVLDSRGRYTVFAPVNDAFDKLPSEVVAKYNSDDWINHLQSLLLYHGLGQRVYSSDLTIGLKAKTLEG
eukprot:CAMPEP_0172479830 /NCGR_PEP_ID=MMETSP1066-20121228/4653_1 /TAXON_ID=671091 /ORGANISM="Coscinodiscus wailesii, Strain CCMP2513" /LENGTH=118 /DNA_ID=CAMNT_0013240633 /DNA_START=58 /DNA_END=410 /DNA_ORIENTATION=+